MQIIDFTFNRLSVTPKGVNLWELDNELRIWVNMPANKGYKFTLAPGFVTNFRSGSDLMNPIIPRQGMEDKTVCYVLHDALYTWVGKQHLTTKDFADDLLKAMLTFTDQCLQNQIASLSIDKANKQQIKELKSEILGSAKIWTIWKAVAWFGKSAYMEANTAPYDGNSTKIKMEVL